jgi:Holliday junction resolvasome RuvABC endonuclease subunit
MKVLGIDPSINSTGLCINIDDKHYKYYIITNSQNCTKKFLKEIEEHPPKDITYLFYDKNKNDTNYNVKEVCKLQNFVGIMDNIKYVLRKEKPDVVYMEGISYGSGNSSALADLAGLNFMIRYTVYQHFKTYNINIVSPKELKSRSCGNGNATKEEMVYLWFKCDKKMEAYKHLKVDDLADAYFLTRYV